ncbi:MAG: chromate transporter [Clostridiales bacterium]|jgi:chromate transporter|nr:chromate transporter [Clostridiales bacterium]
MEYLELFYAFLKIGAFCIGGGYASLPLIKAEIVDAKSWITLSELTDIITIAEMTPGPIALNASTFVGTKILALPGAVVATAGFLTVPVCITAVLGMVYIKYGQGNAAKNIFSVLRPAVTGLIASAALSIIILAVKGEGGIGGAASGISGILGAVNWVGIALMAGGFFAIRKFKVNPMYVILASGVLGYAVYSAAERI